MQSDDDKRMADDNNSKSQPTPPPPDADRNSHLTGPERRLVKLIESAGGGDDVEDAAIKLVKNVKSIPNVNFHDCTQTTPLQHAAFRGRLRLARALLERGADPNDDRQEQGYTSLMFGALSGTPAMCQLLLEYGASPSYINRGGKTAAQLAAFCGQHACAAAINNFVHVNVLEYYTRPHGLETEPLLVPGSKLATPLHHMMIETNMHPVHLLTIMVKFGDGLKLMLDPPINKSAVKVFNTLLEKQFKSGDRINECYGLKFHYLASLVGELFKLKESQNLSSPESFKKHFLKGSAPYGYCGVIDQFICDALTKFPYPMDSPLLRHLVRQIIQSMRQQQQTDGGGDLTSLSAQQSSTTSIALIQFITTINGERFYSSEDDICAACGESSRENRSNKKCSSCKMIAYCNAECQKLHWFSHKKFCPTLQREREKMDERGRKYAVEEAKRKENEAAKKAREALQQQQLGGENAENAPALAAEAINLAISAEEEAAKHGIGDDDKRIAGKENVPLLPEQAAGDVVRTEHGAKNLARGKNETDALLDSAAGEDECEQKYAGTDRERLICNPALD